MDSTNQMFDDLLKLYADLRTRMRDLWSRDLPMDELLFDRWERARSLGFGDGASIYHSSYVFGDVRVGPATWIGPHTILDGTGGLQIGSNCSISAGVQIYSHDSVAWAVTGGVAEYEQSPVTIGDNCYLGPQAVVARGVTIGDGSVIGACSFVNTSLPANSFAVGAPCRLIGHVRIHGTTVTLELDGPGD